MIYIIKKNENTEKDLPYIFLPVLSVLYSDLLLPVLSVLYSNMLFSVDDCLAFFLGDALQM